MGSRSSTTTSLPAWARPYAETGLRTATSLVAPGSFDPKTGKFKDLREGFGLLPFNEGLEQQIAGFGPDQEAAMEYLRRSVGASAGIAGAGVDQMQRTLAGDYLHPDSNPYLSGTYDAATRALTNQYQQAIAPGNMVQAMQAGGFGGSAQDEHKQYSQFQLGQNLADLANQIYGGNYQAERANQLAAAANIPALQAAIEAPGQALMGIGTLEQSQRQTELDAARTNAELRQEYPFKLLSYLLNAIGTATGGGGQVTAGTSK